MFQPSNSVYKVLISSNSWIVLFVFCTRIDRQLDVDVSRPQLGPQANFDNFPMMDGSLLFYGAPVGAAHYWELLGRSRDESNSHVLEQFKKITDSGHPLVLLPRLGR